jgi:hypothetical protein
MVVMGDEPGGQAVMPPPIRFRLLGPVTVESVVGLVSVGGPTARAVLATLLLRGEAGLWGLLR